MSSSETILGIANLVVLGVTAAIVARYTSYTGKLLDATRKSVAAAQASLELERLNNRPFVILTMSMDDDQRHFSLYLRNLGRSVATSVTVDEFYQGKVVKSYRRAAVSSSGQTKVHRYHVDDATRLVRSTEYAIRYTDLSGRSFPAPARMRVVGPEDDWLAWVGDSVVSDPSGTS